MSGATNALSRRGAVVILMALAASSAARPAWADEMRDLSRAEVKEGLAAGAIILVDVREPDEFAAGHIAGAVPMPLSAFDAAKLPVADGKQLVFYCHSGRRARLAYAQAQAAGRSGIAIYGGSMIDWEGAGEPVARQ